MKKTSIKGEGCSYGLQCQMFQDESCVNFTIITKSKSQISSVRAKSLLPKLQGKAIKSKRLNNLSAEQHY